MSTFWLPSFRFNYKMALQAGPPFNYVRIMTMEAHDAVLFRIPSNSDVISNLILDHFCSFDDSQPCGRYLAILANHIALIGISTKAGNSKHTIYLPYRAPPTAGQPLTQDQTDSSCPSRFISQHIYAAPKLFLRLTLHL